MVIPTLLGSTCSLSIATDRLDYARSRNMQYVKQYIVIVWTQYVKL